MSTAAALAPSRRAQAEESERYQRHLEIVSTRAQRRARPRLIYAVIVVGGIAGILLAQLMLSIVVADGAYKIAGLQVEQRDLDRQHDNLSEHIEILTSTQNLTANAEALGMVASGNPVFLDLATGAVSGIPTAGGGTLTGQNNMIGNSLLTGDTVLDAASIAAAQAAAGIAPVVTVAPGTIQNGIAGEGSAGSIIDDGQSGASSTGSGAGSVTSTPGTLASPTTH